MAATKVSGYVRQEYVAPSDHTFSLPDSTTFVRSTEAEGVIQVYLRDLAIALVSFERHSERSLRTSPHGIVDDNRAVSSPASVYKVVDPSQLSLGDFWATLYAFWIRHSKEDVVPLILDSISLANADEILAFLTSTGLAFYPPDARTRFELLLVRASFWQGAGAPMENNWLQSMVPHPSVSGTPFPLVQSFTRAEHVLTTHPLRPPKPSPGSIIYSRFIFTVNEQLRFIHIDASNPAHFEAYARWQNSDRVNVGWNERGPDEKHRKYLANTLVDPHTLGFVIEWNGELAGYGELCWVKEDRMGTYVGGLGDYDQGTHLLIGEEKFRGRERFTAVVTSLRHVCFLRDPRTEVVVAEPRADLPIVQLLLAYLPEELNRDFELPHKRAAYVVMRRERFFQAAMLN
ncbi:putative acyltransferase [Lentinula raphanica]|uniref:Acyltransferase n=1 Tax=Lentinula raphanica TaxID=153919 RepID=A0AA38P8S4_9AGAR|nr:putative acyltransferase [Lentinula raphanica]KAJ3971354.1 putative acyltransferase [Lentinula raphanica]